VGEENEYKGNKPDRFSFQFAPAWHLIRSFLSFAISSCLRQSFISPGAVSTNSHLPSKAVDFGRVLQAVIAKDNNRITPVAQIIKTNTPNLLVVKYSINRICILALKSVINPFDAFFN